MAWTTTVPVSTGELATAAHHNDQVLGNLNHLRAGGFALASQGAGDILYASSASQFARLAAGASGRVLQANGASAPSWVASLAASIIGSGTFDAARIPNLNASIINAGTFPAARLPTDVVYAPGGLGMVGGLVVGVVSVSWSTDQHNYNIPDDKVIIRVDASSSPSLTGVVSDGVTGRIIIVHNVGSSAMAVIDESGSSTAANRFSLNSSPLSIGQNRGLLFWYDGTTQRWRLTSEFN
jgi:hypothetical protein